MSRKPRRDPTPEQIRKMCEKIRAGWSDHKHTTRGRGYSGEARRTVRVAMDRAQIERIEAT